jgi:mRNA deadenylase 3'-5' endonuclease subunit Ccr4
MLSWGWRKSKLVFELSLWSADIMCLQEVDKFQDLEEEMKHRGYSAIWKMRTGNAVDGCAIFWRSNRFDSLALPCVDQSGILFRISLLSY